MKARLPLTWVLIGLLLVLAAGSRFVALGGLPLQPSEALSALGALNATVKASPFGTGSEPIPPAYAALTAAIVGGFGASEAIVRSIPALAGIGVVLSPLLLVARIGWTRAISTSLFLLISSANLSVSRSADSHSLAALGLLLPVLFLARTGEPTRAHMILAGTCLGVGLSSGPAWWMGAFAWTLGAIALRFSSDRRGRMPEIDLPDLRATRPLLGPAVITLLLLSTDFGTRLGQAGSGLMGVGQWLAGWRQSGFNVLTAVMLLPVYEPLLLVGGILGGIQLWRSGDRLTRPAVMAALGALVMFLLYPDRQPQDLIWIAIPLAFLCGGWCEHLLESIKELDSSLAVFILGGVLLTLGTFSYFQFQASMAGFGLASLDKVSQLYFALASMGFAGALVFLFGIGWSWKETSLAAQAALLVALTTLSLSASRSLSFPRPNSRSVEIWRQESTSPNVRLLERTLTELARTEVGREAGLPIEVRGDTEPVLAWSLRQHQPASSDPSAGPPPVILVPEALAETPLPDEYLGQAFGLIERHGWSGALPPEFFAWWLDRRSPTTAERWILYVRSDVVALDEPPVAADE